MEPRHISPEAPSKQELLYKLAFYQSHLAFFPSKAPLDLVAYFENKIAEIQTLLLLIGDSE